MNAIAPTQDYDIDQELAKAATDGSLLSRKARMMVEEIILPQLARRAQLVHTEAVDVVKIGQYLNDLAGLGSKNPFNQHAGSTFTLQINFPGQGGAPQTIEITPNISADLPPMPGYITATHLVNSALGALDE